MTPIASAALARRCVALATSALAALALCVSGGTASTQPAAGAAPRRAARSAPQTGAYVIRLGADTLFVERYTRRGTGYDVEQVIRTPQTSLRHSHLAMTPSGQLTSAELMLHRIGGPMNAPLLGSTKLVLAGDSATVETRQGDSVQTRRVAARADMIPAPPASYLPYELAAMRLRGAGADSIQVSFVSPGGQVTPVVARRLGADSVIFVNPAAVLRARVDREGRLLGLNSPTSTFKITLERVPSLDINKVATAWSAMPAMGLASPHDWVMGAVGGANVSILYSRPRKRNRVIFGPDSTVAVESWGKVWRAGANEATRLTTDRDLVIGGATVPAGTYTLWVLLDPNSWKLIINKQTLRPDNSGRPLWGTMYDAQYDLARVDMTTTRLPTLVEQHTIALEPQRGGSGTLLRIAWDTYQATVPITAK